MADLVLRVTILAIECSPLGARGRFLDWIVKTKIEQVISGDNRGTHFAFRVHSPSRAGLEVGKGCTLTARAVEGGHTVDENQWSGAPHAD